MTYFFQAFTFVLTESNLVLNSFVVIIFERNSSISDTSFFAHPTTVVAAVGIGVAVGDGVGVSFTYETAKSESFEDPSVG